MNSGLRLRAVFFSSCFVLLTARAVVTGPGASCLRVSSLGTDGQTLVTFLREDAAGARLLYLTRWSDEARLVSCEINSHPSVTEGYRRSCDGKKSWGDEEVSRGVNVSMLLSRDALCARSPSRAPEFTERTRRDGTEGRGRRKRSWIFPGTLWCGSGTKAEGYEQLGMFERADRCCREHDHCSHIIPAFTVNYGVFNPNFYTVSHCECDRRFRQCLLGMNDSISSMVGYSFFSILKVPCFELKQLKRCTQMYWWGMCKVAKKAPYAVFKSPLPYNSSDVSGQQDNMNLTNSEEQRLPEAYMLRPQRKPPKTKHRCDARDSPRGDTFHHRTKGSGCKRHQKIPGPGHSQVSTTPRTRITTHPPKRQTPVKKRFGKKKNKRKNLTGLQKKLTRVDPQTQTTHSPTSPLKQRLKPQHQTKTRDKEGTTSIKHKNEFPKQHIYCGSRNNSSQLYCENCLKQETASHVTTIILGETKTKGLTTNWVKNKKENLKKTTKKSDQGTSGNVGSAAVYPTPIVTKRMTTAAVYRDEKSQKWLDLHLLSNRTTQQPSGGTAAASIQAEKDPVCKNQLPNVTDSRLQCQSLKHLDDCKFKIPPLEKKYNLQNMEFKTAYHCDCTSRLALKMESFRHLSIPRSLLVDFVSEQCFTLPKEKKYVLEASLKPLTYIKHLRS
ncbi:group 3 secretory phospholipase A2 isoform X2 [Austrofundulus limnaeus]|uniref:phospholipase A2 n=1 Tax=Austrofundulus limnaeus TaxID=52670 RepID=A0A2I4BIF2_AUSLI|nr:PREDICTED: group 3 secretory phospholipase A2-like isoform X2 [Austrofundulus limnaeus]